MNPDFAEGRGDSFHVDAMDNQADLWQGMSQARTFKIEQTYPTPHFVWFYTRNLFISFSV